MQPCTKHWTHLRSLLWCNQSLARHSLLHTAAMLDSLPLLTLLFCLEEWLPGQILDYFGLWLWWLGQRDWSLHCCYCTWNIEIFLLRIYEQNNVILLQLYRDLWFVKLPIWWFKLSPSLMSFLTIKHLAPYLSNFELIIDSVKFVFRSACSNLSSILCWISSCDAQLW